MGYGEEKQEENQPPNPKSQPPNPLFVAGNSMTPQRIVYLIHDLKRGGAEQQLLYLVEGLDRSHFQPEVITMMDVGPLRERVRNAGVPLHSLNLSGRQDFLKAVPRLRELLRRLQPDILHTFLWYADILGRLTAASAGVPVLINSMRNVDDWRKPWHTWLDRLTAGRAQRIVSNSVAGARRLVTVENIPPERLQVIHNGIDIQAILSRTAFPGTLRRNLSIPESIPLVGCVGRLHKQKNLPMLLRAFQQLLSRIPSTRLVLIGDGPLYPILKEQVGELKLSENVTFTGEHPDPASVIADLDLLVLPSDYEGLPNVLLEAGLQSRAVIATAVGGVPEVIRHGEHGLLIQPGDQRALVHAMETLLNNPSQCKELGQNLKSRILNHFSMETMVSRHQNLYQSLIPTAARRVMLFVTKSDIGGAQKHVADLAQGLKNRGWNVEVTAGTGGELFRHLARHGITTHFLPTLERQISPWGDLQAALMLRKLLLLRKIDLLHCHSTKAGLIGRFIGRWAGIPAVFTAHGFVFHAGSSRWRRLAGQRLEAIGARLGQGLMTVSHHDAQLAFEICPADSPIRVIPNGISADKLRSKLQKRLEIRKKFNLHPDAFLFGSVGRFCREKAFDVLLTAVSQCAPLLRVRKGLIALCGEGPEKKSLQLQAQTLGIADLVHFLPGPEPAAPWYAAFDAYLLPSRKEGCPYTLLEAGAAELAVLASRTGGIPDVVIDGLSGKLVAPEDAKALAAGLVDFLTADRERLAGMGKSLRQVVESRYTLDAMTTAVESFYLEVLGRNTEHKTGI